MRLEHDLDRHRTRLPGRFNPGGPADPRAGTARRRPHGDHDERYVIPPAPAEQAHGLEELATECSLDYEGGPGMGGSGPFGESSGGPAPIVAPWFRSIFYLQPDTPLILKSPIGFRLHALCAWALFAFWPFSRLVHVFSAPLGYLTRPYIVYRSRDPRPGARPARRGWERVR